MVMVMMVMMMRSLFLVVIAVMVVMIVMAGTRNSFRFFIRRAAAAIATVLRHGCLRLGSSERDSSRCSLIVTIE